MEKQLLAQVILDQKINPVPDPLIARWQYSHILSLINNDQVIVITGLRRCGKSTLLYMVQNHAVQGDYCINFDDDRLINFTKKM